MNFKAKMHQKPRFCEEQNRLDLEHRCLLAQWERWKDEVKMAKKTDPAYATKVEQMKEVRRRLRAVNEQLAQHASLHPGCW